MKDQLLNLIFEIKERIIDHQENQRDCEMWDDQHCSYEYRIEDLRWTLAKLEEIVK